MPLKYPLFVISYFFWFVNRARNPSLTLYDRHKCSGSRAICLLSHARFGHCMLWIHVRLKVHHRVKSFLKYWSSLLLTFHKVLLFNVYLVIPATDSTCMITARDLSQGCRHTTVVYNQFNASKAFVILQLQVKSLQHTPFYLLRKET